MLINDPGVRFVAIPPSIIVILLQQRQAVFNQAVSADPSTRREHRLGLRAKCNTVNFSLRYRYNQPQASPNPNSEPNLRCVRMDRQRLFPLQHLMYYISSAVEGVVWSKKQNSHMFIACIYTCMSWVLIIFSNSPFFFLDFLFPISRTKSSLPGTGLLSEVKCCFCRSVMLVCRHCSLLQPWPERQPTASMPTSTPPKVRRFCQRRAPLTILV